MLESEKNQNSERHTCIVISIPGLNDWEKKTYKQLHCSKLINRYKRNLDEDNCELMDCSESIRKKEKIDDNKKIEYDRQSLVSEEYILNFPIPINDGKACIVKVINEFLIFILHIILTIFILYKSYVKFAII